MNPSQPGAFLALWNSISDSARQPEYEAWHTFEHVPERVGLPGFTEARRYRSLQGRQTPPAYFTCYWLATAEALNTPEYGEVFDHPTPWSARMRTALRDFLRVPCTLGGAYGQSSASQLATLHLRCAPGGRQANHHAFATLASHQLAQRVGGGDLVCAQWGSAVQTRAIPIANRTDLAAAREAGDEFVVMLHGLDHAALREQAVQLMEALRPTATEASPVAFFELLSQVRQDELTHPVLLNNGAPQRQPPRPDLFRTFKTGDPA